MAWTDELRRLRAAIAAAAPLSRATADVPFGHLLRPIADDACERVEAAGPFPLTTSARDDIRRALVLRLAHVASQAIGARFSGDRTLADVALSRVADDTTPGSSTDRYHAYSDEMAGDSLEGLLTEFPVLGRLLGTAVLHWVSATAEMLTRIADDRAALDQHFGIASRDAINSVKLGLSDPHLGGRGVAVLVFESGRHLVYKPRPVTIEARFQHFLAVVARQHLRRLAVLERGTYGYVEYVEHIVARDSDELREFYVNAGRLLALLFLLGATDCHWENLIAARDQLVLVDAETLFEGVPKPTTSSVGSASAAANSMSDSVLRTGMLPAWLSVGPARSIDISALGAPSPLGAREPRPGWCFVNTDDMVWGDREAELPAPTCLPVSPDRNNPLSKYGADLIEGFSDLLAALTEDDVRHEARRAMEAFRGARRRIVVRATRTYALIQEEGLAPDALRGANERALRLERLARAYLVNQDRPPTWPLFEQEIAGLEDLDIPYFDGVVGSQALYAGDGVLVDEYYEKEGLSESLARLDRLSASECEWQSRLIRGAIAAHHFEMTSEQRDHVGRQPSAGQAQRGQDVADIIKSAALEDPTGPPTWLTVALMADATRVQLGLVPPGLYDGRAGIAAFLHDCGETDFAAAVLQPVLDALDAEDPHDVRRYLRDIGLGMSGIGGILRLFVYRAVTSADPDGWLARANGVVTSLRDDLLESESASDLLAGIAGLAAPVAGIHEMSPTDATTRVLTVLGRLLSDRQDDSGGWPLGAGHPALAGLSHGASGVATALAHVSFALDDPRCADAAALALRYEAGLYDPARGNWPDLRKTLGPVDRLAMRSWCHGSVGVALARLRILELIGEHPDAPRWRADLDNAVEASIAAPPMPVDHLCCGNLGRAVIITMAGSATDNTAWQDAGARLSAMAATTAGNSPANYRLLLGIDGASGLRLPGLMTGLAGVGMHLLHGSDVRWAHHLLV